MKTTNRQSNPGLLLTLALLLALSGRSHAADIQPTPVGGAPKRRVLVSIPDRKLFVLEDGRVVRTFAVAVGAAVSPSPTGEFQIVSRISNPTYYHPGVVIPAGAGNPIGTRWVGLNKKGYGIHGTNEPRSIGRAASHGCIRLRNRDIERLFAVVRVGDTVEIRGERADEAAQIFGGAQTSTNAALNGTGQ
jgi:lipoprotein-anchoring transpeptidase ErfK/SrfK